MFARYHGPQHHEGREAEVQDRAPHQGRAHPRARHHFPKTSAHIHSEEDLLHACISGRTDLQEEARAEYEGDCIDHEDHPGRRERDQGPGERRPQNVHGVPRDAEQRVGLLQLCAGDNLGHQAIGGGPEECGRRPEGPGGRKQNPEGNLVRQQHRRGEGLDGRADDVADQHDPAAW